LAEKCISLTRLCLLSISVTDIDLIIDNWLMDSFFII
jgi:hypothetical protein